MFGPWWPVEVEDHYSTQLQLQDGDIGLLPDTGAHDGLCGDAWARQQAAECHAHGKTINQYGLSQPRVVAGVGQGTPSTNYGVSLTTGLQDTSGNFHEEKFEAPCLENSSVPGLMGIKSLRRNDALIRCKTGEIWFLGQGGVKIEPSPGSRHFQMREAKSGHWLLPINRFNDQSRTGNTILATEAGSSNERPPTDTQAERHGAERSNEGSRTVSELINMYE